MTINQHFTGKHRSPFNALFLFMAVLLIAAKSMAQKTPTVYTPTLYQENLMVPMRDGVKLATDIYRPSVNGQLVNEKLPILFQRTPYSKSRPALVTEAKALASKGYIVVVQDCRGRYKSEGTFTKYLAEPNDGFDAIEALGKLPYSNGKIGMFGTSYGAHVQANAAKLNPPHLNTAVVIMGGTSNGWESSVRNYGPLDYKQVTWAFSQIKAESPDSIARALIANEKVINWFYSLPLKRGLSPLAVDKDVENYIFQMIEHENYDSYWKEMGVNWKEYYKPTADIPMMLISGWYDGFCKTTVDNFQGLSKLKKSPIHLIMGPYTHGGWIDKTYAGDVEFGKNSPVSAIKGFDANWQVSWFNHFLKGENNYIQTVPRVQLFVMGTGDGHKDENGRMFHGGYWRYEDNYPLKSTSYVKYYLQADKSLSTSKPKDTNTSTTYTFDPNNPVPTIGSSTASSEPMFAGGFFGSKFPYLPLKARKDVIVFQTEPLAQDMEVVGAVTVNLFISSDAPDTDFTAKLVDVYPPSKDYPAGYEMNITDGIMRAKFHESPEKQVLLKKGEVYQITIKPFDTGNIFKKGHRIRLDISSSNFPHYEVNPNTGENPSLSTHTQIANNTIYHNAIKASYVELPMVPTARK
jgi:putative CocE/NonD family hydrolase